MNLLIGSGFQLDFLPIKIHINRHHDRLLTWRTKSNGSLPGNLAPRVLISLLAYENNSTLQRLSFQSEIKLQIHHVDKVNPRGGGEEGVGAIPSKVFLSFFLKDKRRIGRGVAYMFFSVHLWKLVEMAKKLLIIRGSYRGIPVMRDWLILFSVKREFNKLFFVIRDLKVLRDPWRTWIINRYSWFHHSIWRDFEMRVLRKTYFKTENIKCDK